MAKATLSLDDPNVQRVLNDPGFQQAWKAQWQSGRAPGLSDRLNNKSLSTAMQAAGGLPDDHIFIPDAQGNPILSRNETGNMQALGKAGLYTGLAAGAAFGVPALAGVLGGGGAAGGAAAAASAVPVGTAGTIGAGTGGGMLGALGGLLGGGSTLGKVISTGTDVAGQIAAGRAAGRAQEARNANETNATNSNRYRASLDAAQFDADRRKALAREALSGSMLKNLQDTKITAPEGVRMGQVSGGLRPSLLTNRGVVGDDMERKATMALLASNPVTSAPKMPDLVEQPESSWMDNLLTGASYAGTAIGTLRDSMTPKPSTGIDTSPYNPVSTSGISFAGPDPLKPNINLLGRRQNANGVTFDARR